MKRQVTRQTGWRRYRETETENQCLREQLAKRFYPTLEEMDAEIRKTSTCIVVDADEIKKARNWIELHNGKIGTFLESVSGRIWKIECSFRQLVAQNIIASHDGDTAEQFVKDARRLAKMLEKAAQQIEDES